MPFHVTKKENLTKLLTRMVMLFVGALLVALIVASAITPSYTASVGSYTDYGSGTMTTGRQVLYVVQENIEPLFTINLLILTELFFGIGLLYLKAIQKRV